ncbi:hypothetical protein CCP3SC1AL1_570016 [Gammaproteobacteria bacterium]
MPSPTLAITLTTSATCDTITLVDATADYGGGTVTTASITGCVITVNLIGGSYLTYTFTVLNNTITAATLGISGATATSILSELASTVFPFVATPFDLWADYGVTVPTFADGVVEVDYTISGIGYAYTTSAAKTVLCVTLCCALQNMGQKITPDDCCENCLWEYLKAEAYSDLAVMSTNIGNTDRAALFIEKAQALCDCNCGN